MPSSQRFLIVPVGIEKVVGSLVFGHFPLELYELVPQGLVRHDPYPRATIPGALLLQPGQ